MRSTRIYIMIFIVCAFSNIKAQVFNNYNQVYVVGGTHVYIQGASFNSAASSLNIDGTALNPAEIHVKEDFINEGLSGGNGNYRIYGHWQNNNLFDAGVGTVFLEGDTQFIGGTSPTTFYNLVLGGTGVKTQLNDQYVSHILNLNNIELQTDIHTLSITNTDNAAIQQSSGFVSSSIGGKLSRKMAHTSPYLFPVGSSQGVTRYRPVEIMPLSSDNHTFSVRMANVDASTEGYDRSLTGSNVCATNPLYYHVIDRDTGSAAADLSIFFDALNDGVWEGIAHWTNVPQWDVTTGSNIQSGTPLSKATMSNWDDFSEKAYILYAGNYYVELGQDTTICLGESIILDAGSGFETYLWSSNDTSQTLAIDIAGTYYVTVTDANACQGYGQITIDMIHFSAEIDTVTPLCDDDFPIFLYAANDGGVWYGQGITDSLIGLFDPNVAGLGVHTITYALDIQCGDTASRNIEVIFCQPIHAVVPDAFSPNGDGQNDILYVLGEGIVSLVFTVYSRWGEEIFKTTDKNKGWDGTYKNKALEQGVYTYALKVRLINNEEISRIGNVTLIR